MFRTRLDSEWSLLTKFQPKGHLKNLDSEKIVFCAQDFFYIILEKKLHFIYHQPGHHGVLILFSLFQCQF